MRWTPWDSPDAPQNLSVMEDSQELIFSCGNVEVGSLLIDKECVRDPDLIDVISRNNKLGNSVLNYVIVKV